MGMSQPRAVFPGVTYHITRSTIGRMFLLRPDATVNQIMLFCLFRAAEKFGVLVPRRATLSKQYQGQGFSALSIPIFLFLANPHLDHSIASSFP